MDFDTIVTLIRGGLTENAKTRFLKGRNGDITEGLHLNPETGEAYIVTRTSTGDSETRDFDLTEFISGTVGTLTAANRESIAANKTLHANRVIDIGTYHRLLSNNTAAMRKRIDGILNSY